MQSTLAEKVDEITKLRTKNTDQASQITNLLEKCDGLTRDLRVKSDQFMDKENQMDKLMTEFDDLRYKYSDMQKDMSEARLKAEVLKSVNDSLTAEKDHLTIELKETRDLEKSYEKKCGELII